MTLERRIVRHTIRIQDDEQTVPTGPLLHAQLRRDYPDDILALKLDLWIETQPHAATDQVVVVGTDQAAPEDGTHLATVVDDHPHDPPVAWHLYRIGAGASDAWAEVDRRALVAIAAASEARHRRTCGAAPQHIAALDPAEQPFWRATCQEPPGHDATNPNTPHRATGLGRHGQGELAWVDE